MKQLSMFNNGTVQITLYGSFQEPWFRVKEVSQFLGIQNPRNIVRLIHNEDKHIVNDGRSQYFITETGLYTFFVYAPKTTTSLSFQRWVKREVLPSIRYKQVYKQQQVIQQLENFIENINTRQKTQVIYIATSERYSSQNVFKVGGCSSQELLSKRLTTYNTGRIGEDELYYVALFNCDNHNHMEARIKELLYEFRYAKEKEMYVIQYTFLYNILQLMIQNYSTEIDQLNDLIRNLSKHLVNDSSKPVPIAPFPKNMKLRSNAT